ncbi:MAG: protein kinase [Hyphomicrobiaceae bacterium]
MTNLVALPVGTELVGDFRIERVLGAGGFGITYLALETALARQVTIKEYFPVDFAARAASEQVCPRSQGSEADYAWGLDRFLDEAKTLAKFNHPNIVRVYRYFRDRNTGYIVLHFEEGKSFKDWLKALGRTPRQQEIDAILVPLLDALEVIHSADFLHRDIAPDNIIIRTDGTPVLIDFGSARGDIAKQTKTLSALVKPGYSPFEQYATTSSKQGPWTDIYSLAATLYVAVTGTRPQDAPSRMVADELVPVRDAARASYRPGFLAALDRALAIDMNARPRSILEWRAQLLDPARPARGGARKAARTDPPAGDAAGKRRATPTDPPKRAATAVAAAASGHGVAAAAASDVAAPSGPGLIGSFLEGWREGGVPAPPAKSAPKAEAKGEAASPPPAARAGDAKPAKKASPEKPRGGKATTGPPAPAPVGRAAVPAVVAARRPAAAEPAGKQRSATGARRWRWRSLVVKLLIGVGVAGVAVALQDQIPGAHRQNLAAILGQGGDAGEVKQIAGHAGGLRAIAFAGDGATIVTAGDDATLKVWRDADGTLVRSIALDHGAPTAMALHGGRAATAHRDGTVVVWDWQAGTAVATFRRNEASVWAVAFLGDGDTVAATAHDWVVSVWKVATPDVPAMTLRGHGSAVQAVAYAPVPALIATAGADKSIRIWRKEDGSLVRSFRAHADFVTALAFDDEGKLLASGSLDGRVKVWSASGETLHYDFGGHTGRVAALSFGTDGGMLASASEDGSLRLWNARGGKAVRTIKPHAGGLAAVVFGRDGQRIAAGGADGRVRIYSVGVAKPGT